MPLTNTELRYYDSEVLRLPLDKRTEYNAQVDRLVDNLRGKIKEHTEFKIVRVVKAGSFAKHTILRKTSADPLDVDVVFYLRDENLDQETYESLSNQIYDFLVAAYPTKAVDTFTIGKRTATVEFIGSGLTVDVVPVIQDTSRDGYGWQFSTDGAKTLTCAPCQIQFVRDRKTNDAAFRTLVRLAKRWRNQQELQDELKSFVIELIMAYLLDRDGKLGTLEQRFCNFLLYVAQSELKETISFPENKLPLGEFADPVIIFDPVNSDNNVAGRMKETERAAVVEAATASWETAYHASAENDLSVWKELFGPRFRVEDEA
jgi:hypothetical protein